VHYPKRLYEAREGSLGWSEAEPQESNAEELRAPKAAREIVGFPLCLLAFSKDKPPRAAFRARGSPSPTWGSAGAPPQATLFGLFKATAGFFAKK